jgi:hypothetical protein
VPGSIGGDVIVNPSIKAKGQTKGAVA